MSLNNRYQENSSAEKMLGAVYTPPRVAAALARWAVRSSADKVLDPACGEGVFLAAARTRLADLGAKRPTCVGVDIDPQAASASVAICQDFFEWAKHAPKFDAIVGNPPFIRSHLFPEQSRALAFRQMEEIGLRPSRLMSTWAPFVAVSCKMLTESGRLAFVVPEEILHVNYAEELRRFLLARFRRVIVCLPAADLFPSVQQAVVLLLCDNETRGASGLMVMSSRDLEEGPPYEIEPAPPWSWSRKWTHVFLRPGERKLVTESFGQLGWSPLKEYGRVEVGVVTGYNRFFILSRREVENVGDGYVTPIICSARDVRGIRFTSNDFRAVVEQERPAFLIHTDERVEKLPQALQRYVADGEEKEIHLRYKCRIREPWYAVPGVWPADALLLRQAGEVPKLVHLTKKYTSTDTIHRVRWQRPSMGRRHALGFLNTWTLIACEIMGRSYGGGVLELMPGEANGIPLPPPLPQLEGIFERVDERVRRREFDDAIRLVDEVVMPGFMTRSQREDARNILSRLIARRKSRRHG